MQINWEFNIAMELTVKQKQCGLISILILILLLLRLCSISGALFWETMQHPRFLLFLTSNAGGKEASQVPFPLLGHTHNLVPFGTSFPPELLWNHFFFSSMLCPCLFHNTLYFFFSPGTVASPPRSFIFTKDTFCTTKMYISVEKYRCTEEVPLWKEDTRRLPHTWPLPGINSRVEWQSCSRRHPVV